jgi:hypothetical protein
MELTSIMVWTIISIALTVALTFGIALGTYLWHLIPERSRGAKERCRIVYDGFLIKKVNEVIRGVEKGDSFSFDLGGFGEEIKPLSLKSTKNCLDELNKVSKDYTDMRDIANDRVKGKLEEVLENRYKNISSEKQEKISSHLGSNGVVAESFLKYFPELEDYIIKAKVGDEDISFDWFKKLPRYRNYDWKEELNEIMRDAGRSLERIFEELNSQLNDEASVRFLKKYQRVCLNEAKNVKEKLERDAKKLRSKWGFVYGIGDEQMLQDLKEKIKIQEVGSSRGRI